MHSGSFLSRLMRAAVVMVSAALAHSASAQINLTAGDVAIVGRVNNGTPDSFSFVALSPLPAGTIIYFTDNGWLTAGGFRGVSDSDGDGNENLIKFQVNTAIAAGTIISSAATSADWTWTKTGPIPGTSAGSFLDLSFSQSGDTFYALQSASPSDPVFVGNNTFQHLFAFDDTNGFDDALTTSDGNIPPGLTPGSTAVSTNFTTGGSIAFNTSSLVSGTKAQWLAAICTTANWSAGAMPTGSINVVPPTNPSVTNVTYSGGPNFSGGASVSFTVTLSGPPVVSPATIEVSSSAFVAPITVNISAPNTSGAANAALVSPIGSPVTANASAIAQTNATSAATSANFSVYPAASVGLSPSVQTSLPVGPHSVSATVFAGPNPVGAGVTVNFSVVSGPNMGASASLPTNGSGVALFTYTSNGQPGQDVISASGSVSGNAFTGSVVRNWVDTSPVYLTEIFTNAPGGADQATESVEIQGNGGRSLAGFYFIVIEGDATPAGTVDKVIDLSALLAGSNGLLLLRDTADVLDPAPDAATTVFVSDFDPDIENDGNTYLLGWGTPPALNFDVDANNDGAIDPGALAGFTVVDAVAYYDGDNGGLLYADEFGPLGLNLPQDAPNLNGWTPDQVIRILSPNGAPCGWAGSDVAGSFPGPYTYAPNEQLGFAEVGYAFVGALQMSLGTGNLKSPAISSAPSAQTVNSGDAVTFTVSGIATSFQWRRNGMNLSDDANISGSSTNTLQIASASGANAGNYDVVLTSPCGSVTTTAVALTVNGGGPTPCQVADFDDNNAVSVNDLFAFLSAWFAQNGGAPGSPSADIDGNNTVSVNDLFAFLSLWFQYNGQAC